VIEILYLTVRADNIAAIRLYERCGFEKLALLERDTQIGDKLLRRGVDAAVHREGGSDQRCALAERGPNDAGRTAHR
jgi:RimJ/RimL family protein N-acetyltransferase